MKRLFFKLCRQWQSFATFLIICLFCLAYIAVADTLTVTIVGSGTGSVNSNPTGIACTSSSSPCSAVFANMSGITLNATPDWKSLDGVFSVGCSGTGSCSFNINGGTGVTTTFDLYNRVGIGSMYIVPAYATITGAYAVVDGGKEIWTPSYAFSEDVVLDRNIFIKLTGGTEGGIPVSGASTTLQGTLNASVGSVLIYKFIVRDLVVSGGSVEVNSLTIQ